MTGENKVQFNLKNVHYAPLTAEDPAAWDTPVHVPGAVNLSLKQQGELTKFYADGIVYWQSSSNNGYEGDLEMARFPDQMRQDIWGEELVETDNVLMENATVQPKAFALLFQIDGDQTNNLYCLYNCMATRPSVASSTTNENKEPQTQSCTISAAPLPNGDVKAATTATTTPNVRSNWFKNVYVKGAGSKTSVTGVSISGTPQVSQTLTATVQPGGATVSYEWQQADSAGGVYSAISGETSETMQVKSAQENKYIKVKVTGTGEYIGTATSDATGQVTGE